LNRRSINVTGKAQAEQLLVLIDLYAIGSHEGFLHLQAVTTDGVKCGTKGVVGWFHNILDHGHKTLSWDVTVGVHPVCMKILEAGVDAVFMVR